MKACIDGGPHDSQGSLRLRREREEATTMAAFGALGIACCLCTLLITLHAPATAQRQHTAIRLAQQEDRVMTATVSSSTKADACNLSMGKAFNLCIIRGLNNIKHVTCECTESGPPAAPNWECVGTAMCQK
jgi:hypothetical protein